MRVACVSDTHLTVDSIDSKSLFPKALDRMFRADAMEVYDRMRIGMNCAWESVQAEVAKTSPDAIVHMGDVTGGWKESGMMNGEVRHLAHQCVMNMRRVGSQALICPGNHDLGYSHSGSLGGGMTEESVFFAEQVFRRLWWNFEDEGGVLHLGVASPIAEYTGKEESILRRVRTQRQFVGDSLSTHDGPWVLYTHSPWVVGRLFQEIEVHRDNLLQVVAGDLHNPARGAILRTLGRCCAPITQHPRRQTVAKALAKTVICPSVAPLWWGGHGFMTLNVTNGVVRADVRSAPRAYSGHLPTESAVRCLAWMLSPNLFL